MTMYQCIISWDFGKIVRKNMAIVNICTPPPPLQTKWQTCALYVLCIHHSAEKKTVSRVSIYIEQIS